MDIFLQLWGGGCYLLNKILLAQAEGRQAPKLKIGGWGVFLLGLPAWLIILIQNNNWIAAAIEAGGAPAMVLGLVGAIQGGKKPPKSLDRFAAVIAYMLIVVGIGYSLVDYGGLTNISQGLEIGVMAGFLGGTYLLAKRNRIGWVLFMLMNGSMGTLMLIQGKPILAIQQAISLLFVLNGYVRSRNTVEQDKIR